MIRQYVRLLAFLLTACATTMPRAPDMPLSYIEPQLKPLVDEFYQECKKVLGEQCQTRITLTVKVDKLSDNTYGVCYLYDKPYQYARHININSEIITNPTLLRVVLFHELIHCVLEQEHYDTQLDLMNTYTNEKTASYLLSYWQFYLTTALERARK
jgi:hypothetical protein